MMLRRLPKLLLAVSLIVVAFPLGAAADDDIEFKARLDPSQEVADPPVVSDGEGSARFDLRKDRVKFRLKWEDLTSPVIFAHIHCGVKGVNGPVGVTLIHEMMDDEGRVKGSFTAPDTPNDCGWDSLADVIGAMATGGAYVNIHTEMFQGGEIRGQVRVD
jgi:CHRD domain